jgi:hypothetical protein
MTDPSQSNPRTVTVSRDALRADLAEMELRLRLYFDEQLKHKADTATVIEHSLALDRFAKGDFTTAQTLAIEEIIDQSFSERVARGWTTRERWFGVLTVLVVVLSFLLALHASGSPAIPT